MIRFILFITLFTDQILILICFFQHYVGMKKREYTPAPVTSDFKP